MRTVKNPVTTWNRPAQKNPYANDDQVETFHSTANSRSAHKIPIHCPTSRMAAITRRRQWVPQFRRRCCRRRCTRSEMGWRKRIFRSMKTLRISRRAVMCIMMSRTRLRTQSNLWRTQRISLMRYWKLLFRYFLLHDVCLTLLSFIFSLNFILVSSLRLSHFSYPSFFCFI